MSDTSQGKANALLLGLLLVALELVYLWKSGSATSSLDYGDMARGWGGGSFPPKGILPQIGIWLLELSMGLVAGLMSLEILSICLPAAWRPRRRVIGFCYALLVLGFLANAELVVRQIVWPLRRYWIMCPDATRYWTFNPLTVQPGFTVNSHGLRGPEINPDKKPGEYRILCLGNSVSAGHLLAERHTYPFVLQGFLRKRCPGVFLRVQNGAVYGYSTIQGRMVLEDIADEYKPDLVIVSFTRLEPYMFNDAGDPLLAHRWPLNHLRAASFQSMLYLTLRQALVGKVSEKDPVPPIWLVDQKDLDDYDRRTTASSPTGRIKHTREDAWQQTHLNAKGFWWFVQQSWQRGFKLVYYRQFNLTTPRETWTFAPTVVAMRDRMRRVARREAAPPSWEELKDFSDCDLAFIADVPIIDLQAVWQDMPDIARYMTDDSHPNVIGTAMQATDIGNFLLDRNLVPGSLDRVRSVRVAPPR